MTGQRGDTLPVSEPGRTPAERSMDKLAAEARKLRAITKPSKEQRARLYEIESKKLPAAWRTINQMREGSR